MIVFFAYMECQLPAQSVKQFPSPDVMLTDAAHKQPKSGVQHGPGNSIVILQGVGTPTTINILSFGRKGTLLAAGKDFGRVVVWDMVSRTFLAAIDTGQGIVRAVAISADGQTLASAGEGDHFSLKLWHLPEARLLKRYDSFGGFIHSIAFGPKGDWLVLAPNGGGTQVLDFETGNKLLTLKEAFAPILSSDGRSLLTTTRMEFVLWNTSDWSKSRVLPRQPVTALPLALNLTTDALVALFDGSVQLLRLSTGELLPNLPAKSLPKFNLAAGGFTSFDVNAPDLLFGHSAGRLWAWNSKTGQTCVSDILYSESGTLSEDGSVLAGAKDNSFLAQGQAPDGVQIWDTKRLIKACGLLE